MEKDNEIKEEITEEVTSEKNDPTEIDNEHPVENSKGIIIAEVAIAAAAVAFIGYALATSGKKNAGDLAADAALSADASGAMVASSSINMAELQPAALDISELNTLTEEECLANVEAGTMVKLEGDNGVYVYCNNFNDPALYEAAVAVTDEELDNRIYDDILVNFPEYQDVDHDVAQEGDNCDITYIGTLNGETFQGGSAENYHLTLGSQTFIPGFEEGVVGMTVGETKDITLTFPEDYFSADLAGQEVVFSVRLNRIVVETYPEKITDEIASMLFADISTAKECEDYYRSLMAQEKIYEYEFSNFYVSAIDQAVVDEYFVTYANQIEASAISMGYTLDTYLAMSNVDMATFANDINEAACEAALYSQYYSILAKNLDVTITDEDINEFVAGSGAPSIDELYSIYGHQFVTDFLLQTKVMAVLTNKMAPETVIADSTSSDAADDAADDASEETSVETN